MPPSRKRNSRSNPGRSGEGSQHLVQPQSSYKRSKRHVRKSRGHDDTTPQIPGVDITALHTSAHIPNDVSPSLALGIPHNPYNPASIQAECRNAFPNVAGPVMGPVATQFHGAQGFHISGQPRFTNIGGNMTTVNNYGGTHGLDDLKDSVSFAALHDSAEQDPKRRCHPGTRKNVLSQLGYWIDNPNNTHRIFWLHGPAGAGKSAIAQTIADNYKERGVAATFFFYRSDSQRNNGNRLFPTLAWQLAFSIPAVKNFIVHALEKTPHLSKQNVETQFEQLVAYPFHPTNNVALPQSVPVVIIDGLDECAEEELQRRILVVIGNAVKDCLIPLHFLICSRPEALIEDVLDQFKDFTLRIDLATLDDSNRDIEKYLVDQFSDIRSKRGLTPTWPGTETIEEFVFKSSGNFIFAATVMRYISDEDCDPEDQLNIVRNLKPRGKASPFALLDELYLEILKRQRDQDFLKTFLALFIGRTSIDGDFHEDDAMLMNVSDKNLHMKLRRMRSLLKFESFIDVYHKSFPDFLQDSSRSEQYYISKQDGQKCHSELTVDCVIRHISAAIDQPNGHEECRFRPQFRSIVEQYPPKIVLPVEDWQKALKPLLCLQDRLLGTLKPQLCHFSQAMRELLLHLAIMQGSHPIATAQVLESNVNDTVTEHGLTLVTEAEQNLADNDLDRCLFVLLSCLQTTDLVLAVDTVIIERMSSLLAFDYAETAARVRSVTDAQKLIDLIDILINNETFLSQCSRDVARKAALLASKIYAKVPLLPRSVLLNGPIPQCDWLLESESGALELLCQSMLISRLLDHNYIVPAWCKYQGDEVKFVHGSMKEKNEPVSKWLSISSPNFVTRIRVMLELARSIRYIHSMDIVAVTHSSVIQSNYIALNSNLHAKVQCNSLFAWQVGEQWIYDYGDSMDEFTPQYNISAFAELLNSVCFDDAEDNPTNHLIENAKQLIERCRLTDPKIQLTMEDVVKEMETWNLT